MAKHNPYAQLAYPKYNRIKKKFPSLLVSFVNDAENFVAEMLEGVYMANPDALKYVAEYNLIARADRPDPNHVSIVQGSGSGHEPAHIMAVGPGMLDAASPGGPERSC